MEHEIEISYPVPRRRLLDLRRLRRAALLFLCASGALFLFINLCTGGPAWSLVVLVSLWFVWMNLLARPLVEDGLAERISRLLLSVCILVLTVELCLDVYKRQEGQNARLAAKLTGYKIDIKSDAEV